MADPNQKHPAEVLADALDGSEGNFFAESSMWFDRKLSDNVSEAAHMLRRIPALEAERDRLLADMRRASQALAWGAERMPEMDQAYEQAAQAIAACAREGGP